MEAGTFVPIFFEKIMDTKILIQSFTEFAKQKNVDRPTMIRILQDVFRAMIKKNMKMTKILISSSMLIKEI